MTDQKPTSKPIPDETPSHLITIGGRNFLSRTSGDNRIELPGITSFLTPVPWHLWLEDAPAIAEHPSRAVLGQDVLGIQ